MEWREWLIPLGSKREKFLIEHNLLYFLYIYYSCIEIVTHVILEFNLACICELYCTDYINLDEGVEMRREIVMFVCCRELSVAV